MEFLAKLRKVGDRSDGITVPKEIIEVMKLQEGKLYRFNVSEVKKK